MVCSLLKVWHRWTCGSGWKGGLFIRFSPCYESTFDVNRSDNDISQNNSFGVAKALFLALYVDVHVPFTQTQRSTWFIAVGDPRSQWIHRARRESVRCNVTSRTIPSVRRKWCHENVTCRALHCAHSDIPLPHLRAPSSYWTTNYHMLILYSFIDFVHVSDPQHSCVTPLIIHWYIIFPHRNLLTRKILPELSIINAVISATRREWFAVQCSVTWCEICLPLINEIHVSFKIFYGKLFIRMNWESIIQVFYVGKDGSWTSRPSSRAVLLSPRSESTYWFNCGPKYYLRHGQWRTIDDYQNFFIFKVNIDQNYDWSLISDIFVIIFKVSNFYF